ncbi:MAG TPA: ABC transporter permease [Capsulimonadaceae bacterium]|nr:ABC transporter permease [Capsulimonadaceae bacterium]
MPETQTPLLEPREPIEEYIPEPIKEAGISEISDLGMVNMTMALRGLSANKLRAFLTMLGVIIGVGAVIIAISIGQGSRAAVAASLQRLGTNVLTIFPGQQRNGGVNFGFGSVQSLKYSDAETLLRRCPALLHVAPQVNKNAQVVYKDKNTSTQIYGTSEYYPVISNHPIQQGAFFRASDVKSYNRVAALGSDVAQTLFGAQNPVGKTIQINGQNFRVTALLQSKGGQGWRNPDDGVYVPVTTAMRRLFGMQNVQNITCQARSDQLMQTAEDEITQVLRQQHKLSDSQDNDFGIFNEADVVQTANEQQDTFAALIAYLAIVSLIVGGIGIMNIMLVSVTERTREIGVRKAIGAKRTDILTQFLLEALLLSLVGGILGVATGVGGAYFIQVHNGWTIQLSVEMILLAFSFSAFVGIFFGFYPAFKASNLNPIEALRYE